MLRVLRVSRVSRCALADTVVVCLQLDYDRTRAQLTGEVEDYYMVLCVLFAVLAVFFTITAAAAVVYGQSLGMWFVDEKQAERGRRRQNRVRGRPTTAEHNRVLGMLSSALPSASPVYASVPSTSTFQLSPAPTAPRFSADSFRKPLHAGNPTTSARDWEAVDSNDRAVSAVVDAVAADAAQLLASVQPVAAPGAGAGRGAAAVAAAAPGHEVAAAGDAGSGWDTAAAGAAGGGGVSVTVSVTAHAVEATGSKIKAM